jgi:hypothetical protein
MGRSKNNLNSTLKKLGRLDIMVTSNMLIFVIILVCVFLDVSWQDLGRSVFFDGIFVLTQMKRESQTNTTTVISTVNIII